MMKNPADTQKPSTKITPTSWLSYSSLGNSIILFLTKLECMLLNIALFKAFGAGRASTSVELQVLFIGLVLLWSGLRQAPEGC